MPTSEEWEMAFAKLKDELCNGVAVKLPNPDTPFVVETDASVHDAGAVHLQSEGKTRTLLSFSAKRAMPLNVITSLMKVNCWQS